MFLSYSQKQRVKRGLVWLLLEVTLSPADYLNYEISEKNHPETFIPGKVYADLLVDILWSETEVTYFSFLPSKEEGVLFDRKNMTKEEAITYLMLQRKEKS